MPKRGSRKCLCCKQYFQPDYRNRRHQRYCSLELCRRASKAASQQRWLAKPENAGYFSGAEQVARVQVWRANHPGYSTISGRPTECAAALQDHLNTQTTDSIDKNSHLNEPPLQDLLSQQEIVFIGFLANLCGSTLQEDIAQYAQRLLRSGLDILQVPQPEARPP